MEVQEIRRGRLIDHVHLVVADVEASRRFYAAVLGALGLSIEGPPGGDFFHCDELFVSSRESDANDGPPLGAIHLAFQAADEGAVRRFHAAGLEAGGRDNGGPGPRKYHPGYFAAFLLDPDGNNVEAVFHGPHRRSADAIVLTWDS